MKRILRKIIPFLFLRIGFFSFVALFFSVEVFAWSSGTWVSSNVIGSLGGGGSYTSLSTDASNNYLMSYYDSNYGDLKFAKSTDGGTTWTNSTVDSEGNIGTYTSITTDPSGNYLISYYDVGNQDLKVAKSTNGGVSWTISTIDSEGNVGKFSSIRADRNGNYLISYAKYSLVDGNDDWDLGFAKSTNGGVSWTISTIDEMTSNLGQYSSLAIDTSNNYLISYANVSDNQLKFAKSINGGTSWTLTVIENAISAKQSSLAVNSSNQYIVAYHSETDHQVKFAKSINGGQEWTSSTINNSSSLINEANPSLATASINEYFITFRSQTGGSMSVTEYVDYAKTTDGGITWTTPSALAASACNSSYTDNLGNTLATYYTYSDRGGGAITFIKMLNDPSAPEITTNAITPDPTTTPPTSITGTATDIGSTVSLVEFQVDSTTGAWSNCTAEDGMFDESTEVFSCTLTSTLTNGTHSIYLRATDGHETVTLSGSEASESFTIDTDNPSAFTLSSPSGYSSDANRPTLAFLKSSDLTSAITYQIWLDPGKNKSYNNSQIPSAGNGSSSYTWKDDSAVRVQYMNEQDNNIANDEVRVFFKGLETDPLTEGKHDWKVTATDAVGNTNTQTKEFYIDQTSPDISNLILANVGSVTFKSVFMLSNTNRMPTFSGKVGDKYVGSEKTNTNGTKDVFDKVSSGPLNISLTILKLKEGENSENVNAQYDTYIEKEYALTNIQDVRDSEKFSTFQITAPFPLIDGYYKVTLTARDGAGNTHVSPMFYLLTGDQQSKQPSATATQKNKRSQTSSPLSTTIVEEKRILAETETEKQQIKEQGYIVQLTIIDKASKPISGAKVTIHSKVQEAYTDEQGIARFTNVESGEHTVDIEYANYKGTKNLDVTGDVKEFHYTIQVQPNTTLMFAPLLIVTGFILLLATINVIRKKLRRR